VEITGTVDGNSLDETQKLSGASRDTVFRYLKMGDDQ
jgi:hypothetical protein